VLATFRELRKLIQQIQELGDSIIIINTLIKITVL